MTDPKSDSRGPVSASTATCALCGEIGHRLNPLVPDEFHDGVHVHLHCLNSPEGRARDQAQREADPQYARYSMLITVGRVVSCTGCGAAGRLSPKGYGMGGGQWEVNCSGCHRHRSGLNASRSPAEAALVKRLQVLWQSFKLGEDVPGILDEVSEIEGFDDLARSTEQDERCGCGGTHSVAARPRCEHCRDVLLDSPFHVVIASGAG